MTNLNISHIAHWALKVADLDRSLAFYRDTLGFPEMMRIDQPDGQLMLVYLRVTDTQFVELFPRGKGTQGPADDAVCVNHICLHTDDIDKTIAHLTKHDIPLWRPRNLGLDGNLQCWIQDPDGNRIEFMQMLPGNMQEKAIARLNS
jgi:lactoylglutathione lyase